jgi:hypothetical protein
MHDSADPQSFIARWRNAGGSERANYQLFVADLCRLLGTEPPEPAREDTRDNAYVFERRVAFAHGDGSTSHGFIDCYRRGAFVLEAKKIRAGAHTRGFDDALLRARAQGEAYARALPAAEGRPPFVLVVDVGHVIELYAEFTRSGATYTPFPDSRSHRIALADLADAAVRERLRRLWTDPLSLDPARASAKVTREVAVALAAVARSLEAAGHAPQAVAAFLTRCLFSMFAEDVELLPRAPGGDGAFVHLLKTHGDAPATLQQMLRILWADMDRGGFSAALAKDVLRFNGKLFKGAAVDGYVLPLDRGQIDGLLAAARANWREVEPAIFGTLLERALDPAERHALGAHYTPRAYVERLVLPTVVEPLRADWADAQAAALLLAHEAAALPEGRERDKKMAEARAELRRFHHRLCTVRVLDPACGSGNFLYVTLEHLKRLEGEVLEALHTLGEGQAKLGLEGETVTLQQLRGIEINERAAALAELVLWIGFLQWHLRTFGHAAVAEPVIHDYGNIEHRDAVLAYDGQEPMRDAAGKLVTRWDGSSFKPHAATGEPVPDEAAQVPQWRYLNPRPAEWPQADFIVGNPPFIGSKRMRAALGDGYVDALQAAWPDVPDATDFVMRWWHHAALLVRSGAAKRFGLITSNSIRQAYVRRAVEPHLSAAHGMSIVFAIPDHPWVDSADGAAVRIAMTVGEAGVHPGLLTEVTTERAQTGEGDDLVQAMAQQRGRIGADLRVGADLTRTVPLQANLGLCSVGMKTIGGAFQVEHDLASALGLGSVTGLERHIRPYLNGRDLTSESRALWVIDLFGLDADDVRRRFPAVYQHLLERAKPERDQNRNAVFRRLWWVIGHPRPQFRAATQGLASYIATVETAKHRVFARLPSNVVPDSTIVTFAFDDTLMLGWLSSSAHVEWALAAGGTLEDRPRYNKTRCFEPFPFPSDDTGLTPALAERIRALAEQIDAHRKARQAAHDDVTLTGLYNVLAKLRRDEPLAAKEKALHERGLVAVLRSLHDELDAAVLAAYGWADLQAALADHRPAAAEARAAAVEMLLERLVALNAKRAAEEAAGTVRWLRPEFQTRAQPAVQVAIKDEPAEAPAAAPIAAPAPRAWPAGLPEQIKAVAEVLAAAPGALSLADLEARFRARGRWRERLPVIVDTLAALGRARAQPDGRWRAV